MIGVQGTFYFGEKGTKTFGVDISSASTSIIRSVSHWSIEYSGSDSPMKWSSNFLYAEVSYSLAIALSPFLSVGQTPF